MAATKSADETQAFDALSGICPTCKESVQVYLPPERAVSGPQAYPALLLHYEKAHSKATPPAAPVPNGSKGGVEHEADSWNPPPPAPADWKPLDKARAERQLPQPAGVWPPVRSAEMPL